jgi:hypothetical protein
MPALPRPVSAALRLMPIVLIAGCATLHAPLLPDESYPDDWPPIIGLRPECKAIAGEYKNEGLLAGSAGASRTVLLTSVFYLGKPADTVSLAITTRKLDKVGDSLVTLEVFPHGRYADRRLLDCGCIQQTLVCQTAWWGWHLAPLYVHQSTRAVYISGAGDGGLIAKLQDQDLDAYFAVPVNRLREPWARFTRVEE